MKMADLADASGEKLPDHVVHHLLYFIRESDAFTPKHKVQFVQTFQVTLTRSHATPATPIIGLKKTLKD